MTLTQWRMDLIVRKHRQLDGYELAIVRTVEIADIRCEGNDPKSEELYAELGPAKWLCVVVRYERLRGEVVTAYPFGKGKEPPTEGRL